MNAVARPPQLRQIARHKNPRGAALALRRQGDPALGDEQKLAFGTSDLVVMGLTFAQLVGWRRQHGVPKRTGAQQSRIGPDLPIKAGQGLIEARDADVQIVGERAIEMALEKQRQSDTGDSKRQAKGERSGERQTQAERPPDHATFSGIS
jgi:hypothetical protein